MIRQCKRLLAGLCALGLLPAAVAAQGGNAVITGRVTDAATSQPIPAAQVQIVGTTRGAQGNQTGVYRIAGLAAGTYTLRVLRIGYQARAQQVTVAAGQTATLNFALQATATQLDVQVITATGETQSRREIGNSVARIDSSQFSQAAVQNLSEVLSSRVAGVSVQQSGGTTGTASRVRIRGSNSISLSNDPLIVIDGVRVDNSSGSFSIGVGGQTISRLDDIDPEQIESYEILKGPAASALYGTAAANGVIQITTKRGKAGRTRWNVFAEDGGVKQIVDFPANYAQIGTRTSNGTRTTNCNLDNQARGLCAPTADSLASFNPLVQDSPFRNGWQRRAGMDVSGGNEVANYFFSTDYNRQQGVYEINHLNRANVLGHFTGRPRDNIQVDVSGNYITSNVRLPQNDNDILGAISGGLLGSAFDDPTSHGYVAGQPPQAIFNLNTQQDVNRFIGSVTTAWHPQTWWSVNGNVGTDLNSRFDNETDPPNIILFGSLPQGYRTSNRFQIQSTTANLSTRADAHLGESLRASTTIGAQFQNNAFRGTSAFGAVLLPGTAALGGTSARFAVNEDNQDLVTLGYLAQEELAFRDRLFLTGSIRTDRTSAFGANFHRVYYPSVSGSYVLSDESWFPKGDVLSSFKLRSAYGAAGSNPGWRFASTYYSPVAYQLANGSEAPAVTVGGTGNPNLRPEISREGELGFDAGFLRDRIGTEVTYYSKMTSDALVAVPLAPSLGLVNGVNGVNQQYQNLGKVKNAGLEATLRLTAVDRSNFKLDGQFSYSQNRNKLITFGNPNLQPIIFGLGGNTQQIRPGYPLGAYWQRPILGYTVQQNGLINRVAGCSGKAATQAQNGCGLIVGDTAVYMGSPFPTNELSFSGGVTAFKFIRVTASLDHRGGYKLYNATEEFRCASFVNCPEIQSTAYGSTFERARALAALGGANQTFGGYIENANFTKLRELAVTLSAPDAWARRVGGQGLSLTVAGRNLYTWTKYTGFDPEVSESGTTNYTTADFLSQPLVRFWTARVSVTF